MGNGLGNGRRYYSPTMSSKGLVPGNDGMEAELFVREAHAPVGQFYSETTWKQDVDMMIDIQNKGSRLLSMTKVWTTASETQKNAWHKYALATFLLGSNGNSYFCFYARNFTKGKVVINVGTSASGLRLGQTYRTVDGARATGTVTLPAHSAEFFLK